jgi:hypothetical protein
MSFLDVKAQVMPSTCLGSWDRYAATPDPWFKSVGGGSTHFEWLLDNIDTTINKVKIYANGDSIDIHWLKDSGNYSLAYREVPDLNIPGVTVCSGDYIFADIRVNKVDASIADIPVKNEGDPFTFEPKGKKLPDSVKWNNTLISPTFSGVALNSQTVYAKIYQRFSTGYTCSKADTATLTVFKLPRFEITTVSGDTIEDTTLCDDDLLSIRAGNLSNVTYQWYNGQKIGQTSQSITLSALKPDYKQARDTIWAMVTNATGGEWYDTIFLKRCNSYVVTIDQFKNAFPKTFKSQGIDPSFKVHIVGTTVAKTDSFTLWYYIAEDAAVMDSITFNRGMQSGTVTIKGKNYENQFNGTVDVKRTVKVSKVQLHSREAVEFLKNAEPSGSFYIIHRPRVDKPKYIP